MSWGVEQTLNRTSIYRSYDEAKSPCKKRRAWRKTEPRAIYDAIYYTAYRYGCDSCGVETLEDIEKAYAAGADVNEPGVDGKPPLMLASEPEKEYEGVARWLLEHGADIHARDAHLRTPSCTQLVDLAAAGAVDFSEYDGKRLSRGIGEWGGCERPRL